MTAGASRRAVVTACVLLGTPFALVATPGTDQPAPTPAAPVVYTAVVDGIIHPVSADYMIHAMDQADRAGAALVVFTLRTPGGLVDSTRDIVTRMLASKTPVVVFVGPAGARAASAGFILTIAADVAAMAPGTHIGAAHPVSAVGSEKVSETMEKKQTADMAAYARTLAEGRRRNVKLAELAVQESQAFTEREALDASPPLIDVIVPDVPELVRRLHGRAVRRFDNTPVNLATAGASFVSIEMSRRQRVLGAIAHPNIAFLLLSLGILGITIELWSPGAILPGVVGAISLLLAFFALQLLPVNYAGLLLIVLGLLFLALEIKVTSYGLLTAGGLVSLVFGAMILIDAPEPELRLSFRFVLPVVLGFAGIGLFLVRLAVLAQRSAPVSGTAGMIGMFGEALTAIEPGRWGQVRVRGEIWRALSAESIAPGDRVRVSNLDGLTVTVRRT
jgi:membrane-bound serine protease (ClpP class)